MATEDLNLIKSTETIVATRDVMFAQLLAKVWFDIAAVPIERLADPPNPPRLCSPVDLHD